MQRLDLKHELKDITTTTTDTRDLLSKRDIVDQLNGKRKDALSSPSQELAVTTSKVSR
jgi:hypothetical protein